MKNALLVLAILLTSSHLFSQAEDSLKILSWNVFLRPGILKDRQLERVDSIAASVLDLDADVVVLQEVFHKKSRKRLIASLSKTYPFYTKMGRKSFWGVPSGNCIFSKDTIQSSNYIYYKNAMNADKLAKKGAILAKIRHKGKDFAVFGTHLQAGGGDEGAKIRKSQIDQLTQLAHQNDATCPALFAGDFNIRFQDSLYEYILATLETKNVLPANQDLGTANFSDHTLTDASGPPKWIDFIFLKSRAGIKFRSSRIQEPRCIFNNKRERISDHNPIITVLEW